MNTLFNKITEQRKLLNYILAFLIVLLIPVNLGYHFISQSVYVGGILLDYIVPTVYLQDILTFIFFSINFDLISKNVSKADKYIIWFMFVLLLSTLASFFLFSSLVVFMRTVLYISFAFLLPIIFSKEELLHMITTAFAVSVTLLGILGLLQWVYQGAFFNNYLVFGEQPYTAATPGILLENFFGVSKVPPYGTFRHPNAFAGFLSVALVWLLHFLKKRRLLIIPIGLGLVTLFFTLSYFAWGAFVVGAAYLYLHKRGFNQARNALITVVISLAILSLFLPNINIEHAYTNNPSFYRRADLLNSAYGLAATQPIFGFGPSTSAAYIDRFLPTRHDIRLIQPPHNVFALFLVEAGFLAVTFYLVFFFGKLAKGMKNNSFLVALLLQILILGSFDHYLATMHQTYLLFWLILFIV